MKMIKVFGLLLIVGVGLVIRFQATEFFHHTLDKESVTLSLKKNEDIKDLSLKLESLGVVSDQEYIHLAIDLLGIQKRIQPGQYHFKQGFTVLDVLNTLNIQPTSHFDKTRGKASL